MSRHKVDPQSRQSGHEPTQASPKGLAIFAACFVVSIAAILGLILLMTHWLRPNVGPPIAAVQPPAPNLQPSPGGPNKDWQDLQALDARYRAEFADRGWVGKDGETRVPDAVVQQVISESRRDVGGAQ